MRELNNTISVITGGSKGIGKSIAELFAKNGSKVIIIYNKSKSSAVSVKNKIILSGGSCEIYKLDLSKKNNYKNLFSYVFKKYKKIDILVNNAGYLKQMNYLNIDHKEWFRTIDTNLTSVFFLSQAFARYLKKQKFGNIINISSIGGQTGGVKAPHYAAAKLAIISLTKSFSRLLAPFNVRVNAISPGIIETDLVKKMIKNEGRSKIEKNIPLKKIGNTNNIADTALFLASKKSNYMTGQVLNVNGGQFLG
tara:strand:+ start:260 stop:1012 length:753 start_codon:yes stop_codon:yes gene_type:complete